MHYIPKSINNLVYKYTECCILFGLLGVLVDNVCIMKTCHKCGQIKSVDEFPIRTDSPDGYRNECKICKSEYLKNYHKNPPTKEIVPEGMKRCPGCERIKSIGEFGKKRSRKDGLQCYCKACKKAADDKWKANNPNYYNNYNKSTKKQRAPRRPRNKKGAFIGKEKICSNCKITKDLSAFYLRIDSSDGYRGVCIECFDKSMEEYYKDIKNNPRIKEVLPKGMKKCPCCKNIKMIDNDFGRNKNNRPRSYCRVCARQKRTEYRETHPEEIKQYRLAHTEDSKARKSKRKALELLVEEDFPADKRKITFIEFGFKCYNCSSEDCLCIDHHRPLVKKNALAFDNAVVLCVHCNSSKSARDPEEFYGKEKCTELDKKLTQIKNRYEENSIEVDTEAVSKEPEINNGI